MSLPGYPCVNGCSGSERMLRGEVGQGQKWCGPRHFQILVFMSLYFGKKMGLFFFQMTPCFYPDQNLSMRGDIRTWFGWNECTNYLLFRDHKLTGAFYIGLLDDGLLGEWDDKITSDLVINGMITSGIWWLPVICPKKILRNPSKSHLFMGWWLVIYPLVN